MTERNLENLRQLAIELSDNIDAITDHQGNMGRSESVAVQRLTKELKKVIKEIVELEEREE